MSEYTAAQAANELSKVLKTFKVLENAQRVLSFLVDQEKYVKDLEASTEALEYKYNTLKLKSDSEQSKLEYITKSLKDAEDKVSKLLTEAEVEAKSKIDNAEKRVKELIDAAKAKADAHYKKIDDKNKEFEDLNRKILNLTSEYNTLQATIAQEKQKFLEKFK